MSKTPNKDTVSRKGLKLSLVLVSSIYTSLGLSTQVEATLIDDTVVVGVSLPNFASGGSLLLALPDDHSFVRTDVIGDSQPGTTSFIESRVTFLSPTYETFTVAIRNTGFGSPGIPMTFNQLDDGSAGAFVAILSDLDWTDQPLGGAITAVDRVDGPAGVELVTTFDDHSITLAQGAGGASVLEPGESWVWTYQITADMSNPVPEGGTTLAMLGLALVGIVRFRRTKV